MADTPVTVTKHYENLCDMPACICPGMIVAMFLKDDLLTLDAHPYIEGTVISVTEDSSGGVDVVISYNSANMPLGEGDVPMEVSFGDDGTCCDPDCLDECSWLKKVIRVMGAGTNKIINRFYQLFGPDEDVTGGDFDAARVPFPTGFRLSDCRVSCYSYDVNTTCDMVLMIGATTIATFSGNLGAQAQFTLIDPLMVYDGLPVLTISALDNTVYGMAAKGLVLELIGVIEP